MSARAKVGGGSLVVLIGIVLLSFNLRPAAVSVGPILTEIHNGLGMTIGETGLLTSLPVLAFAVFGALAPKAAHLLGLHRTTLLGVLAVTAGLIARGLVSSPAAFLLLSVLALAGMATANVLLPSLVKLHFPDHIGLMTAVYSTALAVGLTAASVLTVPIAQATDSWRWGLLSWGVVAAMAIIPWLGLLKHDLVVADAPTPISLGQVARTRLGWAMAVCFGLQSIQAYVVFGWLPEIYRDAGFSAGNAGLLLGIVTGTSIPMSFWLPSAAARRDDQTPYFMALMAAFAIGYLGLIFNPATLPWLWAVLIGIGCGIFPLVLTLIGLRARTAAGTRALSGFTQSVGYLLAGAGPWAFGVLHDLSGGWTWPLIVLLALIVPMTASCLYVAKPAFIEDEVSTAVV